MSTRCFAIQFLVRARLGKGWDGVQGRAGVVVCRDVPVRSCIQHISPECWEATWEQGRQTPVPRELGVRGINVYQEPGRWWAGKR